MSRVTFIKRALAVSSLFVISSCTIAFASNLGRVNNSDIRLRDSASFNSNVLGYASESQIVRILSKTDSWTNVSTDKLTNAYMATDYIDIVQTDATCMVDATPIRAGAAETAEILGTVNKGTVLVCTGRCGDYYSVKFDGKIGYISKNVMSGSLLPLLAGTTDSGNTLSADDIKPVTAVATTATTTVAQTPTIPVSADTLTAAANAESDIYAVISSNPYALLMNEADEESKVLTKLPEGYSINISSYVDGWILATDDEGNTGYISENDITLMNGTKPKNTTLTIPDADLSESEALAVVNYSMNFIGTPYVYGGTDLTAGVDCSGFTLSVYQNFGITLNRIAADQYLQGTYVPYEELKPGDLVFFNTGGDSEISHVGMYIGDDKYIHSTDGSANGVTISDITSDYCVSTYVGAKRLID
jgi:cell wall-associated NlpC family hydrolase